MESKVALPIPSNTGLMNHCSLGQALFVEVSGCIYLQIYNYVVANNCCHFHIVLRGHIITMKVPLMRGGIFEFVKSSSLQQRNFSDLESSVAVL
jgi:hypothetical protein